MQRLLLLVGAGFMAVALSVSASWAESSTASTVTAGAWGQGVAVVDPAVPANDSTPSNHAAIDLKITLRNANGGTRVTWDNGRRNVIGGCSAPACLPAVMKPGVYRFPYIAGVGGPVAQAGIGHFTLYWHDAGRRLHSVRLPIQSDTGFTHLASWAKPSTTGSVTTRSWWRGVAVVDPSVPANDLTPSNYAAIDLKITLRDANGGTGLTWDNGPGNVIGGCGAPVCVPAVMKPGVYRFAYAAGADGQIAEAGIGHFTLRWHDSAGSLHFMRLPIQSDTGFAHLPSWATPKPRTDMVTTGTWGRGVAVVDPTVPANGSTPSAYAAVDLKITLRNANGGSGLTWDNGPNSVIGGCGAPVCMPAVMKPGVYRFPYVAGEGSLVPAAGIGHFNLRWHDAGGRFHSLRLPIQSDPGFAHLPTWAKP